MLFSGAWGKMIHEKNLKQKSRDTVPLTLLYTSTWGILHWPLHRGRVLKKVIIISSLAKPEKSIDLSSRTLMFRLWEFVLMCRAMCTWPWCTRRMFSSGRTSMRESTSQTRSVFGIRRQNKCDKYTVKKVNDFPVPSRDVTYQTLPVGEYFNYVINCKWHPGLTEKSLTFFTV